MNKCSGKTLSELFNLSQRRIEQLTTGGHVTRVGRGQYDLLPSIKGYIRYLKELAKASERGLTAENLKIKEMKRLEMEGKLINADELKLVFAKLFTDVKTKLQSVRYKCSQEITHIIITEKSEANIRLEIDKILQTEHDEALKELGQWKSKKKGVM